MRISEARARELAAEAGIVVGRTAIDPDGSRSIQVGEMTLEHNGRDGKACWRHAGYRGYKGDMIGWLVRKQTTEKDWA